MAQTGLVKVTTAHRIAEPDGQFSALDLDDLSVAFGGRPAPSLKTPLAHGLQEDSDVRFAPRSSARAPSLRWFLSIPWALRHPSATGSRRLHLAPALHPPGELAQP